MSKPETIQCVCPCCRAVLTVDPDTGDVLMHKEPAKKGPVFDLGEAARALKDEAGKRDDIFKKSLEAEKNKPDILKKKFNEALRQAKENPDAPPPPREIDLD